MVRRPPRPLGPLVALLIVAVGAGGVARAQDARELQAKEACLGGHPDKGIELLAQLYAETNDPTYIYNQGRCFEQNGRATDAVTRFREYLRKAQNLAPDEKTDLQKRIDDLEAQTRPAVTVSPAPGTRRPGRGDDGRAARRGDRPERARLQGGRGGRRGGRRRLGGVRRGDGPPRAFAFERGDERRRHRTAARSRRASTTRGARPSATRSSATAWERRR